jgi:NTE family protein
MKIGLALSGGGFRATIYHLGVLARLAEQNRLEEVTFLSTVSGGSLCAGLVYAQSGFHWPASQHYLNIVAPNARKLLTTQSLQGSLIWRFLTSLISSPLKFLETRADDLSALLQKHWGITIHVRDLPEQPRWMINTTCYETGKNWRFERSRMGDYVFGYSADPPVPLSDALAASAGFPGLIGALTLDARPHQWFKYKRAPGGASESRETEPAQPAYPSVHLWDGGVYDNLGLEPLHNFVGGWRQGIDFLIASDASGKPGPATYQPGIPALFRIISGVMMDQIRSLRSRAALERMINHKDPGGFLQIGNTCREVLEPSPKKGDIPRLCPACLSAEDAGRAAKFETTIRRVTPAEFELLFRHGFEVADYTLYAYHPDEFPYVGYANSRWGKS